MGPNTVEYRAKRLNLVFVIIFSAVLAWFSVRTALSPAGLTQVHSSVLSLLPPAGQNAALWFAAALFAFGAVIHVRLLADPLVATVGDEGIRVTIGVRNDYARWTDFKSVGKGPRGMVILRFNPPSDGGRARKAIILPSRLLGVDRKAMILDIEARLVGTPGPVRRQPPPTSRTVPAAGASAGARPPSVGPRKSFGRRAA